MKRDDELMFYLECWRDMQNFLTEVVRDNTGEYPFAQGCPDRQAGCHNTAVCSKWAEYQSAKAVEQSNLPSQQEKEDMRGYITAHRTRYLRRMANKRRR